MMLDSTVTSKGQITIPKEIRDFMHIDPGNKVKLITRDDGTCVIIPMNKSISDLAGMLPRPSKNYSIEEMDEALQKAVTEHVMKGLENDRN